MVFGNRTSRALNVRDECRSIVPQDCVECPVRHRSLLKDLEFEQLAQLHRTVPSQHCRFGARDQVYREGDNLSANMVIFDGLVILYRNHPDGGRQIYHIAVPGDFIPVQFTGARQADHNARAITDVSICAFDRETLLEALVSAPELARSLVTYGEKMLDLARAHVDSLGRRSAEGRLAFLLLHLTHRLLKHPWRDGDRIFFPLTQEHLADWAGLTAVHVNRTMGRLRDLGYLDCHQRYLTINNWQALAKISDFDPTSFR